MGRGPSYPYVDLEQAISLSRKIYDYAKRGAAPAEAVVSEALKLSPTSSGSDKVMAALRSFGLIEDAPGSNGKGVKLTPKAIRILLDEPESAQRLEEIRKAALSPKWYEYCWKKWGADMPPAMKSNLLIEHGFVDSTIDGFLKNYRKSIAFAGLLDSKLFEKTDESTEDSKKPPFKIGDWVQWVRPGGELGLPKAKRIREYQFSATKGNFAFVEGETTGIPIDQLIAADPPEDEKPTQSGIAVPSIKAVAPVEGPKMQTDVIAIGGNSITLQIQWPTEITQEAYDDLVDYLSILQKRAKRAIKAPVNEVSSSSEG